MLFYRIDAHLINCPEDEGNAIGAELQAKSDAFFRRRKNASYMFVSRMGPGCLIAGLLTDEKEPPERLTEDYLRDAGLQAEDITLTEVTVKEITLLLRSADRRDYISDDDDVMSALGIRDICRQFGVRFTEMMVEDDDCSEESLVREAGRLLWDQTLRPELGRIYMGSRIASAVGHPVHYILSCDDPDKSLSAAEVLLLALRANRRVSSGRVCRIHEFDNFSAVESIYRSWSGGTVMIECMKEEEGEGGYSSRSVGEITELCAIARRCRAQVLTIFRLPAGDQRIKNVVMECMGSTPFVELHENTITRSDARAYLRRMAREHGVPVNKKLYSVTEEQGETLTAAVLEQSFSEWLGGRLRTSVYPQYSSFRAGGAPVRSVSDSGSALGQLSEMVGLEEAKGVINRALSYYKAQRMFAEKGIAPGRPAMHMVFTGNPGTAKTTVARLFARIMKDHGLLSCGNLVEVGRADLVGKYVGWTAKIVKSFFQKARGGVLFIDEAYSLVDDKEGMFGDEAINTIVQEMENHREDVVVIFAGYPDKMEAFLRRNPGLRSRIAFHVPFSDYTPAELCDISAHIAEKQGLYLSPGARERLMSVFEEAVLGEDFGNGRLARSIIEQARMEQAVRLVAMDCSEVTREDVHTLLAEDIVVTQPGAEPRMCIGF